MRGNWFAVIAKVLIQVAKYVMLMLEKLADLMFIWRDRKYGEIGNRYLDRRDLMWVTCEEVK